MEMKLSEAVLLQDTDSALSLHHHLRLREQQLVYYGR